MCEKRYQFLYFNIQRAQVFLNFERLLYDKNREPPMTTAGAFSDVAALEEGFKRLSIAESPTRSPTRVELLADDFIIKCIEGKLE